MEKYNQLMIEMKSRGKEAAEIETNYFLEKKKVSEKCE